MVSHVGSRLLADVADRTTLTAELTEVLAGLRKPRTRQDPGRVLVDMAVADGATTVSDIAVLADQAELFGSVASDSTCRRLLDRLHGTQLAAIASARAAAREVVWAQRAESTGEAFAAARAAGRVLPGLVVDLDASIVICHSEKEQAAPTFKHTFGFHPMLAFCDNTGSTPRSPRSPTNITMAPGPHPRRYRRLHPQVPRPHPCTARPGPELRVLCRVGHQGAGTRRYRCDTEDGVGGGDRC